MMRRVVPAGRVVVLNGASSAGKSTLAARVVAARASVGECWIHVAIDDANAKLPPPWFDVVTFRGPYAADGIRFEPSEEGFVVAVGDVGRRLLAVYRRSVALWARNGFDVIVDEVVFDAEAARDWDDALAGLDVTWVAVRCSPDVAAARELARGDRTIGLARGLSAVVHRHVRYDLELDTTDADPDDVAAELDAFLQATRRR